MDETGVNHSTLENVKKLIKQLREEQAKSKYQREAFDALITISQSLGETPTIELVFKQAIEPIHQITGYTTIALRLWDEHRQKLILKAQKGFTDSMLDRLAKVPRPIDESYIFPMLKSKKAYIYEVPDSPKMDFKNVIFIPLVWSDQIIGSMDLGSKEKRSWTEDEISWLELIGRYLGMMIRQIQIMKNLETLSALHEREILARELHDDTLQSISSLMLWAQEAQLSIEENNHNAVKDALEKITTSANSAYKSLREDIFGLRKNLGDDKDFFATIEDALTLFEGYWSIQTSFYATDNQVPISSLKLSPRSEMQLLRITQEALTNIRKHANATRIDVVAELNDEWINIHIHDNGQGFNPEEVSSKQLGLRIMRERAESLGGSLQIKSCFGCGSSISISIPR